MAFSPGVRRWVQRRILRLLLWPEGPRRGEAAWLLPGLWPKGAVTYRCCRPSLGQRRSASTCLLPFQGPKGGEGARLRPGLGSKGGVLVSVLLGLGPRRQQCSVPVAGAWAQSEEVMLLCLGLGPRVQARRASAAWPATPDAAKLPSQRLALAPRRKGAGGLLFPCRAPKPRACASEAALCLKVQ